MHLSRAIRKHLQSLVGQSSLSIKSLDINPQFASLSFQSQQISNSFLAFLVFPLLDRRYLSSDGLCVRLSDFQHQGWEHCLSVCRPRLVRSRSMAGSQQKALAMAGVCTLLLLTFLASDVNAACSIAQLNQCTAAVTRGSPPTAPCCAQVSGITDFNCFCNILLSQRNVPQDIINNAVHVPMKCGALGAKLRNKQCGNVHIP